MAVVALIFSLVMIIGGFLSVDRGEGKRNNTEWFYMMTMMSGFVLLIGSILMFAA